MPRCWPDEPDFGPGAEAERLVWQRLRDQLPEDAALFHSVSFTQGGDDECEADLVAAVPGRGVAVIEVKGGHVALEGGTWWQGSGRDRHRIDPVGQAQKCERALRRYLQHRREWTQEAPRTVHLVALPFLDWSDDRELPDLARPALLDRRDVEDAGSAVERALSELGKSGRSPGARDVEVLEDVLAVTLPGQLDLLSLSREQEVEVELLTHQQKTVLDLTRHLERVAVSGGAGTGKTFLALEKARRLARAGQRVALTCYSRGLARLFQRTVAGWPAKERPVFVDTFHALGVAWGAPEGETNDNAYWEERLPAMLVQQAEARPAEQRFDSVVLDEAQDFGASWWPALLSTLRAPDTGGLFVFYDEGQRVFGRTGSPPDLPLLELDTNVRNTKAIANTFGSLTGRKDFRVRGTRGARVRVVPCTPEQARERADDAVVALLEEGWPAREIALLMTGHRHPVHKDRQQEWGHDRYWDSFFDEDDDVFYGHVLGFKGLERAVVVLGVDGYQAQERAREHLYVGLSRARSLLVVVGDVEAISDVAGEGVRRRLTKDAEVWDVPVA